MEKKACQFVKLLTDCLRTELRLLGVIQAGVFYLALISEQHFWVNMINLDVDLSEVMRGLDRFEHKQMPFATALGINDTLNDVKAVTPAILERDLDKPTPFTKRGVFIWRAGKRRLYGVVGFKDVQAEYLKLQAQGGVRRPAKRAIVVPVGQRLNKYGNLPKGAVSRAMAKPNVFSGKVGKRAGVWQRRRTGGPKLLVAYEDRAVYQRRLRWGVSASGKVEKSLPNNIAKRLRAAMASAR